MLWGMWCFTLLSMGRTNHKFPIDATQNVQLQLKSIVNTQKFQNSSCAFLKAFRRGGGIEEDKGRGTSRSINRGGLLVIG